MKPTNIVTQNLPVYLYRIPARVALIIGDLAYRDKIYEFIDITIRTNQPLRRGDVLGSSTYILENDYTSLFDDYSAGHPLGNHGIELGYSSGCQIDKMCIEFQDPSHGIYHNCGVGKCTIFIPLHDTVLIKEIRRLSEECKSPKDPKWEKVEALRHKRRESYEVAYWIEKIPQWDEWFECIGELPDDLR
jgi:hypothetical protein